MVYRRVLTTLALVWCVQATANGTGGTSGVATDPEPSRPSADTPSTQAESPKIQIKNLAVPEISPHDLQAADPPEPAKGITETILDKVTITDAPGGQTQVSSPGLTTDVGPVSVTPYVSGSVDNAPEGDKDVRFGAGVIIQGKNEE